MAMNRLTTNPYAGNDRLCSMPLHMLFVTGLDKSPWLVYNTGNILVVYHK